MNRCVSKNYICIDRYVWRKSNARTPTLPLQGPRSRNHVCLPPSVLPIPMKTYIFACIHNAGRSQMAAAFFNQLADSTQARALSAGTNPGPHVHPIVVDAMREAGIDLSAAHPQLLTDDLVRDATLLITMGCGEACPYIPNLRRQDWPLPDPNNLPLDQVRLIRDEIRTRVQQLLNSEGLAH